MIVDVNGVPIHESDDAFLLIGKQLAGAKVTLHVRRGPAQRFVDVTLAKLNVPGKRIASSLGNRPFVRGMRVDHASLLVQEPYRWGSMPRGVLVSAVQANSGADRANLKIGDVVTHVSQIPVASPPAFTRTIGAVKGPLELTLFGDPPTKITIK